MDIYVGKSGKTYRIEKRLFKGGEGEIFSLVGNENYVAKIFKEDKRSHFQKNKLEAMYEGRVNCEPKLFDFSTWPEDILYLNGKFYGYIMRKIPFSEELCIINSDDYRNKLNLDHIIAIEVNLSAAISHVHKSGHVVGDLNPKNILVDLKKLLVILIDADSYHINYNNKTYPCSVGVGEYMAPEIMKRLRGGVDIPSLKLPTFTVDTDNFSLAIHIFSLLMFGYHPFVCRKLSKASPSVVCPRKSDNIEKGFSPYFNTNSNFDIPVGSPNISILPYNIRMLFQRAFIDGYADPRKRPSASEWNKALMNNLNICPKNHLYDKGMQSCPWCKLYMNNMVVAKPQTKSNIQSGKAGTSVLTNKNLNFINHHNKLYKFIVSVILIMMLLVGIFSIGDLAFNTKGNLKNKVLHSNEVSNSVSGNNRQDKQTNKLVIHIPQDAYVWNGHSYYVFNNAIDYLEAKKYCESRGGYLATISSKAENDAIYSYIRSKDIKTAYFGLTDEKKEGVWTWVNGEKLTYTNWHRDEPNGGTSENHAMFYYKYPDGKWNDENLSKYTVESERYFICEWNEVNKKVAEVKNNSNNQESIKHDTSTQKVELVSKSIGTKVSPSNTSRKNNEYNEFYNKYKLTNNSAFKKYLEIGDVAYLYSDKQFAAYHSATCNKETKIVDNVRMIQRVVKIRDRRKIAPGGIALLKDDIKGEFFDQNNVHKSFKVKDDTPCAVITKSSNQYLCLFRLNNKSWLKWLEENKFKPVKKEFWYEIDIPGDNTNDTYWVSGLYLSKLKKRK